MEAQRFSGFFQLNTFKSVALTDGKFNVRCK